MVLFWAKPKAKPKCSVYTKDELLKTGFPLFQFLYGIN